MWLNNKELPGTGRPRAPRVGIDKPDQLAVCFVIRGLPHGKPIAIAAAAFDAAGDVIGGIGGMTSEIVTALPLPRPLLWAHFARHAYQLGAPMLVRRVLTEVQKAIHAITPSLAPRSAASSSLAAARPRPCPWRRSSSSRSPSTTRHSRRAPCRQCVQH